MEFEGKIKRVLEARTGTSQRTGNEWKALPVVFYFYEPGNSQTEKSVMLETFDTNIQTQIGKYLMRGQDGKAVVMDGEYRMSVAEIPCKADFSPFFHQGMTKEGKKFNTNEIRTYKIEIGAQAQQPAAPQQPQQAYQQYQQQPAPQVPFPPQQQPAGGQADDLPF